MAEFNYDRMVKNLANDALDNFLYKGKTIREGADMIFTLDLPDLNKATNGDVIKALFPDAKITDHFELGTPIGNLIYIRLCKYQEMRVQYDWWNAPYKKEGDKECI